MCHAGSRDPFVPLPSVHANASLGVWFKNKMKEKKVTVCCLVRGKAALEGKCIRRDLKAVRRCRGVRLPAQPSSVHPIRLQGNTVINI